MDEPLDRIAFLVNSKNRVRVLQTVATAPQTRAELAAETKVARATLGRILGDLEDRAWLERRRDEYVATPTGAQLAQAVQSVTETVETLDRLDDQVQWFPFEDVSFDLGALHEATIVRADETDTFRPLTRSLEHIRRAERVRLLASQHAPPALEALWRATVVEQRLTLELIVAASVIDRLLESETDGERVREMLASERATIYRAPSLPAYNCVDNDGTIIFALRDDDGSPQALVESDAPAVRTWFEGFFERHRAEATRVTGDDLVG